jgi:hypothetical protein
MLRAIEISLDEILLDEIPLNPPTLVAVPAVRNAVVAPANVSAYDDLAVMGLCIEPPDADHQLDIFAKEPNGGEFYLDTFAAF